MLKTSYIKRGGELLKTSFLACLTKGVTTLLS